MAVKTMKMMIAAVCAVIFLFASVAAFALDVPELRGPVNDLAKIIDGNSLAQMTDYLSNLAAKTDAQVAVLTVPSLEGDDLESFSIRTADKWKLGDEKTDMGALIVVAFAERAVRIETGYGAEGVLTDAKCGLIIRNIIAPAFRSGDYGEGLYKACVMIGGLLGGDVAAASGAEAESSGSVNLSLIIPIVFFIFWFGIIILCVAFKVTGRTRIGPFYTRPYVSRRFSGGGFGGGSSFGGFGGGGGGGFSGGGGGFGGGGASGGW